MSYYSLKRTQDLPISLSEAWEFFSSPLNLEKITPSDMNFNVLTKDLGPMYSGQIILYKVSPLLNIPIKWMTEITHVKEEAYFVDEQRFGPYAFWHHQHHFEAIEGGVRMTDLLNYKLPFSFLGSIAHSLFIKARLHQIFDHRYLVLEKKFGKLN